MLRTNHFPPRNGQIELMHILLVCHQLPPFHKTTGYDLGDHVAELAKALAGQSNMIVSVVTALGHAQPAGQHGLARRLQALDFESHNHEQRATVFEGRIPGTDVPVVCLQHEAFSALSQDLTNCSAEVLALFADAVVGLSRNKGWEPDVWHLHDWPTALVAIRRRLADPAEIAQRGLSKGWVVFSQHNLRQLGLFPASALATLGIDTQFFHPEGLEFHGQVSLLKAGLIYADRVTLDCRATLRLLQDETHGQGLHGLYRHLGDTLAAIPAGVDHRTHAPEQNHSLAAQYGADQQAGKMLCKRELQRRAELNANDQSPLILVPLTTGEDCALTTLLEAADKLTAEQPASKRLQWLFVGDASAADATQLTEWVQRNRLAAAHLNSPGIGNSAPVLAGSDAMLICGQMRALQPQVFRAMRYGCIPLVDRAGTLSENVVQFDDRGGTGTGLCGDTQEVGSLVDLLRRLNAVFGRADAWARLRQNALEQQHPWIHTVELLRQIYR